VTDSSGEGYLTELDSRKHDTRGGLRVLAQYADTRHLASVSTYHRVLRVGSLLKGHAWMFPEALVHWRTCLRDFPPGNTESDKPPL